MAYLADVAIVGRAAFTLSEIAAPALFIGLFGVAAFSQRVEVHGTLLAVSLSYLVYIGLSPLGALFVRW